jgi:hypothetical protein
MRALSTSQHGPKRRLMRRSQMPISGGKVGQVGLNIPALVRYRRQKLQGIALAELDVAV